MLCESQQAAGVLVGMEPTNYYWKLLAAELEQHQVEYRLVNPFSRCTRCNGILQAVDKQLIEHRLEPKTRKYFDTFLMCNTCKQIYWQGSHHARSRRLIEALTSEAPE